MEGLENIILNERGQTQKAIYCMGPFICNVHNKQIHRDRKVSYCQGLGRKGIGTELLVNTGFLSQSNTEK